MTKLKNNYQKYMSLICTILFEELIIILLKHPPIIDIDYIFSLIIFKFI